MPSPRRLASINPISRTFRRPATRPGKRRFPRSIFPATGAAPSDYVTVSSSGNSFADAAVRAASSQASDSQTQAAQLSPINQLFDITGSTGILAAFQQFSTAFSNLSAYSERLHAWRGGADGGGQCRVGISDPSAASLDTQSYTARIEYSEHYRPDQYSVRGYQPAECSDMPLPLRSKIRRPMRTSAPTSTSFRRWSTSR